jgi:excisionase family DNA binding protein
LALPSSFALFRCCPLDFASIEKGNATMEPLGVAPKAGCAVIGCGVTKLYELINAGELETYKVGRATRITLASIRSYVARQSAPQQQAA